MEENKKIVLIEDEANIGNLLRLKLERVGYSVKVFLNGEDGLAEIKKNKPDLVLLDIVLPLMSGFDVLKALFDEKILPDLPVIIISNSGQPVEIDRALQYGVRDYLIKVNFDPNEVMEKVKNVFAVEKT